MHFDINELKSRLILLEELLNSTDDKYKKIEIFNDINKIKYFFITKINYSINSKI